SPTTKASTAPSRRLRTQPVRPSRRPVVIAQSRYPTPCTRPLMVRRACSAIGSGELDDLLVDLQAVAGLGVQGRDRAVLGRAQHVLHLHRLDHGERLAGLDLLALA